MRLTLPLPPSANAAWRSVVGARKAALYAAVRRNDWRGVLAAMFVNVTRSREYVDYLARVEVALAAQDTEILEGEVSVKAIVVFADRRRDLDGAIKVLLDVLQGVCYSNDKQIAHLELFRAIDSANPRTEVMVTAYQTTMFTGAELDKAGELPF